MKPYTMPEILDYFEAINDRMDVQMISDYLYDNRDLYDAEHFETIISILKGYIELFI